MEQEVPAAVGMVARKVDLWPEIQFVVAENLISEFESCNRQRWSTPEQEER